MILKKIGKLLGKEQENARRRSLYDGSGHLVRRRGGAGRGTDCGGAGCSAGRGPDRGGTSHGTDCGGAGCSAGRGADHGGAGRGTGCGGAGCSAGRGTDCSGAVHGTDRGGAGCSAGRGADHGGAGRGTGCGGAGCSAGRGADHGGAGRGADHGGAGRGTGCGGTGCSAGRGSDRGGVSCSAARGTARGGNDTIFVNISTLYTATSTTSGTSACTLETVCSSASVSSRSKKRTTNRSITATTAKRLTIIIKKNTTNSSTIKIISRIVINWIRTSSSIEMSSIRWITITTSIVVINKITNNTTINIENTNIIINTNTNTTGGGLIDRADDRQHSHHWWNPFWNHVQSRSINEDTVWFLSETIELDNALLMSSTRDPSLFILLGSTGRVAHETTRHDSLSS